MRTTELHNLGKADRIPEGEGRAFRIGDDLIAVFRTRAGTFHATQATCPHAGGPLADGITGDQRVICPLHGHAFDLRSGKALRGECPDLRIFPLMVSEDGDLLIEWSGLQS